MNELPPHRARRGQERCERCALPPEGCLCQFTAPIELRTRVVVVMHRREVHKTTNTARLVPLALANAQVCVMGLAEDRAELESAEARWDRAVLLFPSDDALELEPSRAAEPITLVVPDGNWRQAHKFARREPLLAQLPRVRLPAGPPSRYALRKHPDPRFLATFEALARALGVLEGARVQQHLEALLDEKVARTLRTRPYGAERAGKSGLPFGSPQEDPERAGARSQSSAAARPLPTARR